MSTGYKLTVRAGARVDRTKFELLDDALAELRRRAEEVRDAGGLPAVSSIRSFKPSDRVAARLEISSGGWFRGADAGVDVMGDGSFVAFSGGMARTALEPRHRETAFDAVRRALPRAG